MTPKTGNGKRETESRKQKAENRKRKCQLVTPSRKACFTVFLAGVSLWHLTGCDVINTGPRMANEIGKTTAEGVKVLISQMKPETMRAGMDGKINDPRYRVRAFVGAGTLIDIEVSLTGAELGFDVGAEGVGGDMDRETFNTLIGLHNSELPSEARQRLMAEVIADWVRKQGPQLGTQTPNNPANPGAKAAGEP